MNKKDNMAANLHPHPSLPARPPPSTYSAPPVQHSSAGARAYEGFTPRSVTAQASAQVSAAPSMYAQAPVSAQPTAYAATNTYYDTQYPAPYGSTAPNVGYSAAAPMNRGYGGTYDPDEEARIAEWTSAYAQDASAKKGATASVSRVEAVSTPDPEAGPSKEGKQKTVVRQGGGKQWEDTSLLEWDPAHPRLFVGNLAGEVTDDSLLKAFAKYPSVAKARVVRDKRTTKSKSYGFVSFSDTDDFFKAAKEMNGKYIGSHPVLIKRATSEVKPTTKRDDNKHKHGKYGKHNRNHNANKSGSGVNTAPQANPAAPRPTGVQKKGKSAGPRILG